MTALALFLAIILVAAALHKAVDRERLAQSAAKLVGAPAALGLVISLGAAAIEAMAALALIFPVSRGTGALVAAILWSVYGLALIRRYGASLDCGCNFGAREKPVDAVAVARPFALSGLALAVFVVPAEPFALLSVFAAFGFFALYAAGVELSSITIYRKRGIA